MIVCLCEGVSDREVRSVIRDGALDLEAIGARCGAGTCCGGCVDLLEDLLEEADATPHLCMPQHAPAPRFGAPLAAAAAAG